MSHLAMLLFHDFPLDLFKVVLDENAKICDGFIAVTHRHEVTEPMLLEVLRHPHVKWMAFCPHEYALMRVRLDWTVQWMRLGGFQPETLMILSQDEVMPPPDIFLPWREEFVKSNADNFKMHMVHTWGSTGEIVQPNTTKLFSAHCKMVKWGPTLGWSPWRGGCVPAGSRKGFVCQHPFRHLRIQTAELREGFKKKNARLKGWVKKASRSDSEVKLREWNPNLTIEEWKSWK